MHKTGLNAKPDKGLHDFTLQSLQYISSIIEAGGRGDDWSRSAGAYDEG